MSETVRVLIPAVATFVVGMAMTPILTYYLFKYKAWKKRPGKKTLDGATADEFNRLHEKNEVRAPRMGGIVVWGSVLITIIGIAITSAIFNSGNIDLLNFLSRSQTWIPLLALMIGAIAGLVDDIYTIQDSGEGIPLRLRLFIVVVLAGILGFWFYTKLDVSTVNIPFSAPLELGWLVIPFFIILSLAVYASGVIDGIDGLSGSVFISVFTAYAIIAFAQNQIDLAAFTASIVGGLLAFLWFNFLIKNIIKR
jgi:phospho-N-acetylmuramoyl-pentapeptide-transferase